MKRNLKLATAKTLLAGVLLAVTGCQTVPDNPNGAACTTGYAALGVSGNSVINSNTGNVRIRAASGISSLKRENGNIVTAVGPVSYAVIVSHIMGNLSASSADAYMASSPNANRDAVEKAFVFIRAGAENARATGNPPWLNTAMMVWTYMGRCSADENFGSGGQSQAQSPALTPAQISAFGAQAPSVTGGLPQVTPPAALNIPTITAPQLADSTAAQARQLVNDTIRQIITEAATPEPAPVCDGILIDDVCEPF
ncbi:hypothetical protein [Maricaulis sp.]|uniref:hypothetical protein n=1 Tax=Maricaulis sp. TaxID=1486257 RepID=UPI002B267710|nr:hypothetical protein [Maricaulis sp.]